MLWYLKEKVDLEKRPKKSILNSIVFHKNPTVDFDFMTMSVRIRERGSNFYPYPSSLTAHQNSRPIPSLEDARLVVISREDE
jgi:hypothetical protein